MKIRLENFRSFQDTGFIESKDINIFIGKNSSGKSTLLRFFPLMKQTISNKTREPILWYTPDHVDLGDYSDVLGKDKEQPIEFSYSIDLNERMIIGSSLYYQKRIMQKNYSSYTVNKDSPQFNLKIKIAIKKEVISLVELDYLGLNIVLNIDKDNKLNKVYMNNLEIYNDLSNNKIKYDVIGVQRLLFPNFLLRNDNNIKIYEEDDSLLGNINISRGDFFDQISIIKIVEAFQMLFKKYKLDVNVSDSENFLKSIFSDHIPFNREAIETILTTKTIQYVIEELKIPRESDIVVKIINDRLIDEIVDLYIFSHVNTMLVTFDDYAQGYFNQVIYIAPLRATVQRYYRLQGIAVSEMDSSGANIPMIIENMSESELFKFQKWTEENFNFKIVKDSFQGHISVNIEFKNKVTRNIIDLGFGYSQLLPILVAIWGTINKNSFRNKYYYDEMNGRIPFSIVIEQPELHLHPAMQAEFIDVCAKIVNSNNRTNSNIKFIIETHSETIINRMSELIKKEKLDRSQVNINVVNISDENQSSVETITFDKDGDLLQWPIGFFTPRSVDYDY